MTLTISIIIMSIFLIAIGILGYFGFKKQMKWVEKRDDAFINISNIRNIDDWRRSKHEVIEVLSEYYKEEYIKKNTTESLYGSLAEKAEELFNQMER